MNKEYIIPFPSIRVTINRLLSFDEITMVLNAIEEACRTLNIFDSLLKYVTDEEMKEKMIKYKKNLNGGEPE